ncbi:uncharacterized protein LOC107363538 [Tetranychus urticae]|uniref:Uncharacterized protein n=1 Tax=Tetranychus urticae TaxID=32264 RepID=T1JTM7_TETUR|nr:uncharacterized protein LOC107363538 [Tetranychus urticae]
MSLLPYLLKAAGRVPATRMSRVLYAQRCGFSKPTSQDSSMPGASSSTYDFNRTTGFDRMTYPAIENLRKFKDSPEIEKRRFFWVVRSVALYAGLFGIFSIIYWGILYPRLIFQIYDPYPG